MMVPSQLTVDCFDALICAYSNRCKAMFYNCLISAESSPQGLNPHVHTFCEDSIMTSEKRQKAVDLSHHLSDLSRARTTSPLKGLAKYFGRPGLISLAGGLPSEAYFPFANISGEALVPESFSLSPVQQESSLSWIWKLFGASKEKTNPITIPKYPTATDDINLAVALQYGMATGIPQLQKFVKEFVEKVYQPAYSDYTTLVQTGNTDGWSRAMQTILNPGEGFLTEDWTYPSAIAGSRPFGMHAVAVAMDSEGMRSDDLLKVLSEWDEAARGFKRPHVIYTVPVGQNPTGVTMGATRKQEIYKICVEFDIIIVEDDPYFFLQQGPYVPKSERSSQLLKSDDPERFIASLAPSYLKFDYQGRVIRLDTFSKYVAPGARLGWFTCNPMFAERLERQGETSTQAPCGFGQALVAKLLTGWKYEGYVRWLHGLAVQYRIRRDFFIDSLADEFHLQQSLAHEGAWAGCTVLTARPKPKNYGPLIEKDALGSKKMFSFVPPTAGMFVWIKIHFENHPSFKPGDEDTLEMQLWTKIADAGVLIGPGWYFAAEEENLDVGSGHFRISFSNAEFADLKKAVNIFGKVVREFFQE
ncbi:Aromatic amino acid aminotransferase C56E4.03 [Grifola frondosa]|uniref:Aromatic amino acid aminotransferase C56E4.03 n=1 Tax=Grifola frondosa TaxID=5627 RepID=A0A1C7M020_GRIFR|nr:Aromatic amino acid aminotransferase C56E4.03 [Grifola frondosa]